MSWKQRATGHYILVLPQRPRFRDQAPMWIVGYWNGSSWKLPHSDVEFQDSYFANINEDMVEVSPEIAAQVRGGSRQNANRV